MDRIEKIQHIREMATATLAIEEKALADRPDLPERWAARLRRGVESDRDLIALTAELDAYEASLS